MYHCPVTFYLVGLPDEIARIIEDAQPQPSFTHHFTRSDEPEEALTAQASAIFADATGHDAAAWARVFAAHRQATTTVTLIVSHDQVPAVEPYFNDIADLWIAPLSAAEASWRFNHWQRACKRYADSWETSQYLEATINSIPSLVWYKSKDGIHHKVNDAFCATVNKTKEQVQGRGHAYIWDVEADDPACIESERRVMAAKSTIVSEETVQTSDGTRLLTTYKSPLYNIDGSVMGTVGVGIDVTQERAYEDEIVEKNHTMETIFTTMDCGVITHSLDGTRLLGINQAALDILGYDSAEDLMAAGFDMVAPSVVSEDAAKMRESIATLEERRRLGEHRVPRAPRQRRHRARHGQREAHRKRRRAALAALPARLHGQEKGRSAQGAPPARSHPGAFRGLPARMLLQPEHQSGRGPARQRRQASQVGRAVRRRAQSRQLPRRIHQ